MKKYLTLKLFATLFFVVIVLSTILSLLPVAVSGSQFVGLAFISLLFSSLCINVGCLLVEVRGSNLLSVANLTNMVKTQEELIKVLQKLTEQKK